MDIAALSTAQLALALHRIVDFVEEPCNRLDFDDFERGESTMAANVYWIIYDTLGEQHGEK